MNTVTLIGRLGKDPVLRVTTNQTAVCEFSLAVDNRHHDEPDWFTIVAWGRLAEAVAEHKSKGDQVAIVGRLTPVQWTTDNGDKRSSLKVTASEVDFLARSRASATSGEPADEATT